jgi:type I restriction enzyme S subunit
MSEQLPKDWKWMELKDVCRIYQGYGFPKDLQGFKDGKYPFYKVGDISKNVKAGFRTLSSCDNYIDEQVLSKLRAKPYPKNTIVFAKIGEALKLNRRAIINIPGIVDNNAIGIKANENNCSDLYLFHFFSTVKLEDYSRATTVPSVRKSDIEEINIPLPPKPAQLAIVSKIEELFSEIENGIKSLFTAKEQLKKYRQSVLKSAFEGKLTNGLNCDLYDLPDEHDLGIAAEPETEYRIERNHNNQKNQKNHSSDKGELPEGWKWVKFGEVFSESPQNGLYKPSTEYGSGTPIVRIDGFYDGVIANDYQYKRVKLSDEEIKRYLISAGDILVNRVNSMPYLGKCGIVKHLKERTVFESNIMKVRVKKGIALPEYFTMYLSSREGITELRKNAKQAVNQASINQTDVSNVMIPLCSIEEQKAIVQAIESRFSVADKMEESITESLQQAEALKQSILKKAFEGRLIL